MIKGRNKLWAGWLLTAILAGPFIVKTIHTEQHCGLFTVIHCTDVESDDHDIENCPICHFNLPLFNEQEKLSIAYISLYLYTGHTPVVDGQAHCISETCLSRGPPSALVGPL